MVIGINGSGLVGTGALIDMVREYEDVQLMPRYDEFRILQEPDGILDLYYAVVESNRHLYVHTAIQRYINNIKNRRNHDLEKATGGKYGRLAQEYIESIIDSNFALEQLP